MKLKDVVIFARKRIIRITFVVAIIGVLFLLFQHYNLVDYVPREWVVLLHVIGAVVFLGNIIVAAAWMYGAGRSEHPIVHNFATNGVNRSDRYFIQPGVLVLMVTGFVLAADFESTDNVGWMNIGVVLFSLSGVVWGLFLRRLQNKMVKITENRLESSDYATDALPGEFYSLLKRWHLWDVVAIVLVVASLGFMSLKPTMW